MESTFFKQGNYIYECKCSPTKLGGIFNTSYLTSSIKKLRVLWNKGNKPSGYRYVFPVNYLDNKAIEALKDLQRDYPSVDIRYYDCDQVQALIVSLEKVGDLGSLVDYIKQARGK